MVVITISKKLSFKSYKMLSFYLEIKAFVLGILIWTTIFGPLFLPLVLIFLLTSRVVHLIAKFLHPELIPISKCDAFVAFAPSNGDASYCYTLQVWRAKGILEVEALRNHFYHCFLSTEQDRRKYVNFYCHFVQYLGYIFKKRVQKIDLQWHIHEHRLEDGVSVNKFIGRWMVTHDTPSFTPSSVFIKERPTWMIKVIPDESKKETTVLFKLHHGICDGYTIVHLVDKLSGQNAPYMFKDPVPPMLKRMKCIIQFPYICLDVWAKIYNLRKQNKTFVGQQSRHHKRMEPENWLISFCTLDLETVKGVRRVTGTNFVSVLMNIQIGALRRFFKEVNPEAMVFQEIPMETFIGHSMGWPQHPVPTNGGGMTNHLTLNSIKANFHMEDPLERLMELDKEFRESKSKGYPVMVYYVMFNIMKLCPAPLIRFLVESELSVIATETGLSSLLASPQKHYLLGHPVENIWLPVITPSLFPTMKLMTVPVSHSGILDVSINSESSLVKSQELLDRLTKVHFVDELEALRVRCQQLIE